VQYLLEEHQFNFVSNQKFLGDVEFDFCIVNDEKEILEIIEIKMFKTDRPLDTQVGNIRSAVAQLKKAINKVEKEQIGYKTLYKSLITNITDDNVYNIAKSELSKDLQEYNINIYTANDFKIRLERS
jgi:hypothetical protein